MARTAADSEEGKSSIQVIQRMVSLIDTLARHPEPLSLKQLAQLTGLHPSTAHRILCAIGEEHLVERVEPSGTYRLGLKLLELGNLAKARLDVRHEALPFMRRLHEDLGETVNLSVRMGDELIYVERTTSGKQMMRVVQMIGARAPLHATAAGKVYLAVEEPDAWARYSERTGLPPYTEYTITDPLRLQEEIAQVRAQHVAFDNEEAEKGVSCIAAGVFDSEGQIVAGLSISAPSERLDRGWASQVKACADEVSQALGFRPPAR